MKIRFKGLFVLFLFIIFIVTACGEQEDNSLQNVMDKGCLILGFEENYAPMGYVNEDGETVGFDIDLANEVCKRLGIELVTKPIDWDKKVEVLNDGTIDCIWNGMSSTPDRAEQMLISEPYLKNELVFAVRSYSNIKTFGDLRGKTIGVQKGSTTEDRLKETEFYKDITVYPWKDNVELVNMLEEGKIDSLFIDSVFIYNYMVNNDEGKIVLISKNYYNEELAIGFRKNDRALCEKIEETLADMKTDGKLAEISTKWFGADITTVR